MAGEYHEKKMKRFRPGNPGRPKGAKNKIRAGFKPSIKKIYQELAEQDPNLYRNAIRKGLVKGGPTAFSHVQLAAHYIDGKPAEHVKIQEMQPIIIKEEKKKDEE